MGMQMIAKCKNCGCTFSIRLGGGFVFHLLHCDSCGKDKSISFQELGDVHLRYLKGLKGPYSIATSKHDKFVQDNYPGDPLPEKDYHNLIESVVGSCECGGHFRMDASPRCPECNSDDFEQIEDGPIIMYD